MRQTSINVKNRLNMKTYTFNFSKNNTNTNSFRSSNNIDYSKILDDIIATDVINKNSYLFNTTPNFIDALFDSTPTITIGDSYLKDDDFIKATTFLANYKKSKKTKYILGKIYKLSDGTPIIFYDNEIQIGSTVIPYTNFGNISYLNELTIPTKKIIIDIYKNGISIKL